MQRSIDLLAFGILPFVATSVSALGIVERYRRHALTVTSHSSQFLENRQHFWGIVPFHAGLLIVLLAHVAGALAPRTVLHLAPLRLVLLESALLAFALLALGGLLALIVRRGSVPRVRAVTGWMDLLVYALLLWQLATGVMTAVVYPWGAGWYAALGAPYLWSLLRLAPDVTAIAALPLVVKGHIVGAWILVAIFPFSRLVHVAAVPNSYLWRRPQVVRWNRRRVMPVGR
jgi:nitrate reductase gamma subunit